MKSNELISISNRQTQTLKEGLVLCLKETVCLSMKDFFELCFFSDSEVLLITRKSFIQ